MRTSLSLVVFGALAMLAGDALAEEAEARLERGAAMLKSGDRAAGRLLIDQLAIELTEQIVASPKAPRLHYLLGRARFYQQDDAGALASFETAVQLDPKQAEYHFMTGVALRYLRKPLRSLAALEQAVALDPTSAKYRYELGDVHYNLRAEAKALEHFEKAIELDPKHALALFKAGTLHATASRGEKARALWERSAAADPRYVAPRYNLGQHHQLAGSHAKALEYFSAIVKLDARDWRARTKLVQIHQALDQTAQRDAERARLVADRKKAIIPELTKAATWCRDQFIASGRRIMAYEHFEMTGDMARRYTFKVLDAAGTKVDYVVSLGSYKDTNAFARESGQLGPGERLFHLDGYFDGAHKGYGFFKTEPGYDVVRERVIAIVGEQQKAP